MLFPMWSKENKKEENKKKYKNIKENKNVRPQAINEIHKSCDKHKHYLLWHYYPSEQDLSLSCDEI